MSAESARRLTELARTDATVAPLALLLAEALRAADGIALAERVPDFAGHRLADGLPLLHGCTLQVDAGRLETLCDRLCAVIEQGGNPQGSALRRALRQRTVDPVALVRAGIAQEAAWLEQAAATAGVDAGLVGTVAGIVVWPLLLACGSAAGPALDGVRWDMGYCPVCAAWPLLAELRGLERRRWLRCGRCGAGWEAPDLLCVFCGNDDFRALGYLAPEDQPEASRAATCERCLGYLKTFTTLGPLPPAEIAVQDLCSLELDMAALDAGFSRPEAPGFPLHITVEPARRRAGWFARGR
ncbi:MAG: formate dehydrogenase accessory protein FdhE [Chloroflexi bacterium]|nr:formate dehydrogenase accessory protein FdhE [Chloroflexota bacterium]